MKLKIVKKADAKKFVSKVRGDQKKTDASSAFKKCKRDLNELNQFLTPCSGLANHVERNVVELESSAEAEAVLEDLQILKKDAERTLSSIDRAIVIAKKVLK